MMTVNAFHSTYSIQIAQKMYLKKLKRLSLKSHHTNESLAYKSFQGGHLHMYASFMSFLLQKYAMP